MNVFAVVVQVALLDIGEVAVLAKEGLQLEVTHVVVKKGEEGSALKTANETLPLRLFAHNLKWSKKIFSSVHFRKINQC